MATAAQRDAAYEARKAGAQELLRDVKSAFVDHPAVFQEIVKNLNLWRSADTVGCFARVEALLATAPTRTTLLARFRDFMPAADVEAWQQSAPEPSDPGKGEGSAKEPITFSDDEAVAPASEAGEDASDDDVVLVSTTLTNPLVDLPHARHECAAVPMPARDDAAGLMLARRFCARCYCTLCDRPVSDCAAWAEHSRYRDEPRWRAVRDALTAAPEPPPRRFKRPRLRGAPAAATAVPHTVAIAARRAAATAAPRAAATAAPRTAATAATRAAAPAAPRARRRRPERPGAFDADDRRETAVPVAVPNSVDDATVAQRTRDLMLIDEEIRRQYRDGSLTVGTVTRAVATGLGVDEEAIKKVVNATLILGTPRRYLLDQVRAELQAEDAAPSPATQDAAPPPTAPDDGNDSDVGAYFELSDDND